MFQACFKHGSSLIQAWFKLQSNWERAKITAFQRIATNLVRAYFKLCSSLFRAWIKLGSTWLDLARWALEPRFLEPSRASSQNYSSLFRAEPLWAEPPSSRAKLELEPSLVTSRAEPSLGSTHPYLKGTFLHYFHFLPLPLGSSQTWLFSKLKIPLEFTSTTK